MSDGVLDDICCVLCNRKGLKSGGTIGDLCICKDCANCSGGIVPNDEYFGRAFQKFSTDNLKEIASSQLLKSIFLGQLYSYRHNIFKTGGDAKKSLCDIWLVDLLSDDQVHTLYNALVRSYNNLKHNDYVLKVLVPEAILYLFAKVEKISRIKAEVVLNSYISERYHENESQNSDSCKSDVNCVSRNENILLNKLKKEEKINTNTIEDKKENELPKNIHIDLCIEDSETFLVKNLLSYLIEKVCNYIDGNDVDFNIQNPQCPTSSCSKKYLNESVFTLSGEEKKVNLEMDMHQVKKKKYLNESDFTFSDKEKKVNLEMDMHQVEKKKYLNESDFTLSGKEKKVNLEMDMNQVKKKKYLNESDFTFSGKEKKVNLEMDMNQVKKKKYLNESDFTFSGKEKKVNLEMDMNQVKKKKYLNESDFTFSGKEKKVNLEMDMNQVKKKKYLNESDFTFSGKEKKVNLEMDMNQVKKKKYLNESDFTFSGKEKKVNLEMDMHQVKKKKYLNESDFLLSGKRVFPKNIKRTKEPIVKRGKKACPVPGCKSVIINLSRHIKESKKMDHIILKRSASKVVSLFGLRKSCAKSCDVIRPRKSVTKSCPVDGCLSTILNLSDHFRKSHPSIYNNAELYDEMKKKAIVISENDKEQIMSIFTSNNPLPSDDSYDSENGSAKIASDKYKKFISQIDSSTDTDSDYIAELDETDESNDEYLPDDINEESINAVLNNFEIHLLGFEGGKKKEKPARQCKNQVKCILNCISPTLTSLDPLFNLQTLREKWLPWALAPGKGKNGKGHLPGTLRSYLGSLSKFIEFLIRQKTVSWAKKMFVPCTINLDVMKGLLKDIKNWSASYCDEVDEREWDVLEKDLANMIDPDEFQKVYNSELS
ncbi:uncharacterized protein LOC105848093 isoform X2 [Hydra vulgaris]|uniref:uncharacterized protein LOC105848093 isoform X2 n=1 Tax=Hydra vulgaris TaxID=6087 RepID=UPI0032EA3935